MSDTGRRAYGVDRWSGGETLVEAAEQEDGSVRFTVVALDGSHADRR